MRQRLQPEIDLYHLKLRELGVARDIVINQVKKARIGVMAWNRGHARLASGETVPAKIDVMKIAEGGAASAVKGIKPF